MLKELPKSQSGKSGWPWTEGTPRVPLRMADGTPWPLISIVTPSLNQGKFLEETIRSVLLQGYPNLEYIIIDGGSTDDSVEIIKKYEAWVSYWVSEKDRGQSDAINKGWEKSRGEIVAYLNSDDLYTPGALAEVAQHFNDHPGCAVVHGHTIVIDQEGYEGDIFGSRFDLISSVDGCNDSIAQPSAFIKKKALLDIGFMDENLHRAMDFDLWLRLRIRYSFHYVARPWSKFRRHPESKSSGTIPLRSDCLPIMKKLYSREGLPREVLSLKRRALAWANLFEAQMYAVTNRPIRAKWHALVAFTLDRQVCLKSGKGLFVETLFNEAIFNRMKKIKKCLQKSTCSLPHNT
jgi:glycosyltransferase involved in cell wall biosynthesis